ncbi:MAG TPA: leucyl aminopeptidase family protein, partial [Acetobacteraceae bacterium]|nr:leucyl aminopeptidase family protein [Acetobacteraceae bacterium]
RLDCLIDGDEAARAVHAVRPAELAGFLDGLPPAQSRFLRQLDFTAASQELLFLPGDDGVAGSVLGLGDDNSPFAFGNLAFRLPAGTPWRLETGSYDPAFATLGFCLGGYRYGALKEQKRASARLVSPGPQPRARSAAASTWMVRDLVNTPANLLGPAELAEFAISLGKRYGAETAMIQGDALEQQYPTVTTVGRGSARPPHVAILRWSGSKAHASAPLISLCGKGVCFDTGGYDLKPSSGMLRMKKDMGGAATVLGLARMIMEADLPVRLAVRVGCVENSVSGTAMRPLDVIRTRKGVTVEVGNTDAEGRLVLCDLLTDACDESPELLVDCATLTGAARVALGPDLPAMFCNADQWADTVLHHGKQQHDPLWRLPLWQPYDRWLDSTIADFNNVSSKPHAGSITAALFLQRFVSAGTNWMHLDLYAWNDQTAPGRPEGGEAYGMRALFASLLARTECTQAD